VGFGAHIRNLHGDRSGPVMMASAISASCGLICEAVHAGGDIVADSVCVRLIASRSARASLACAWLSLGRSVASRGRRLPLRAWPPRARGHLFVLRLLLTACRRRPSAVFDPARLGCSASIPSASAFQRSGRSAHGARLPRHPCGARLSASARRRVSPAHRLALFSCGKQTAIVAEAASVRAFAAAIGLILPTHHRPDILLQFAQKVATPVQQSTASARFQIEMIQRLLVVEVRRFLSSIPLLLQVF